MKDQERHGQIVLRLTGMLAALVASIHKTESSGDQVLEVLATCCLPQLLGQPQQMKNKIGIKPSQEDSILKFCNENNPPDALSVV